MAVLVTSCIWRVEMSLFRFTRLNPEWCCTFFLFGQQLQLELWNYIHAMLWPKGFQKNHSLSYFIKTVKQETTLFLTISLLPSYCTFSINLQKIVSWEHCYRNNDLKKAWTLLSREEQGKNVGRIGSITQKMTENALLWTDAPTDRPTDWPTQRVTWLLARD